MWAAATEDGRIKDRPAMREYGIDVKENSERRPPPSCGVGCQLFERSLRVCKRWPLIILYKYTNS